MADHKKERVRFSTKIVAASVTFTTLYVVATFFIVLLDIANKTTIQVPDTLTTLFFAFWTVELVSLSTIEKTKVRNKYHKKEEGDDETSPKN